MLETTFVATKEFQSSLKSNEEFERYFEKKKEEIKERGIENVAQKIARKKIPKNYKRKFGIDNLWVIKFGRAYRATLTVFSHGTVTYIKFLEAFTHKQYDRRFGYHTT